MSVNKCCVAWLSRVRFPNMVNVYFHMLLFLTFSSMCFDPAKSKKMADEANTKDVEFIPYSVLNGSTEEISNKTLELINSLKVDKLIYPLSSATKSSGLMTSSNQSLGSDLFCQFKHISEHKKIICFMRSIQPYAN